MSEPNHNPSISEMIDKDDDVRLGLYGRPAELQFVRLAADYNRLKTELAAALDAVKRRDGVIEWLSKHSGGCPHPDKKVCPRTSESCEECRGDWIKTKLEN